MLCASHCADGPAGQESYELLNQLITRACHALQERSRALARAPTCRSSEMPVLSLWMLPCATRLN